MVSESSENGVYVLGNYLVTIADCRRQVMLEFSLANARCRKQSLSKANLLVETLSRFRDALKAEAALIEKANKR